MKYAECKNLNKNKAANSQNYFSPISEKIVDINVDFYHRFFRFCQLKFTYYTL